MERLDQQLNSFFAAYREGISGPEPSPEFMPALWGKIEAKRSFVYRLKKMSQLAMGAALAASILWGILFLPLPHFDTPAGSYVDMLADAHADDTEAAMG